MMATQIVELDLRAAPTVIHVRDDVRALLVVVSADGRPVDLVRLPPPAGRILSSQDVLHSYQARVDPTVAPPASAPPVSIVVPTRERPDDLARCLESLNDMPRAGHEVIVVDNSPVTGQTAALAERFGVRYVLEPTRGLNRARNAGLADATRPIVAFVDDDVVVGRHWVEALGACFVDSAVGCATGLVLPLELETTAQEAFELYSQYRCHLGRRVYSREVLRSSAAAVVGMGANMAYRRDLLLSLGGFDVRLDVGTRTRSGGDTDMFARVLDARRLIVYTSDAYVWHRHRRSASEVRASVFGYSVGTFSMLTKRVLELGDVGALITAGRWLVGPVVKAAHERMHGRPAPRWDVVFADTAGAVFGPFCFGYEAWRSRRRASSVSST